MAFGFIKKIFTFGKDTAAEEETAKPAPVQTDAVAAAEHDNASDETVAVAERDELLDEAEAANPDPEAEVVSEGIYPLPYVEHDTTVTGKAVENDVDSTISKLDPIERETLEISPTPEEHRGLDTPIALTEAETPLPSLLEPWPEEGPAPDAPAEQVVADVLEAGDIDLLDTAAAAPAAIGMSRQDEAIIVEEHSAPAEDASSTESASGQIGETVPVPVLPKGFAAAELQPAEAPDAIPEVRLAWYQRLRQGLLRTSSQLTGQITSLFTKRKLDDATLEDLEDLLIQADLGVETAMRITGTLSAERYGRDVTGEDVTRIMAAEITKVLTPVAKPLQLDLSHKPHVILVVGVNGTGKTTTIGKLAAKLSGAGLKVMMAAGDTFRAAAIEQLKIWAERTGSDIVSSKLGADAAGLAYEAFEQAREKKSDVLIIDTAGRLQNKAELMAELEKIVRVLGKLDPDAPHTILQTLDATTGQNALNQVEIFRNVAGVSGLIMTKLDGTARGGILVAIAAKHKLPVYFIGVGEGIDDLEPFEAKDFAEAIAGVSQAGQ